MNKFIDYLNKVERFLAIIFMGVMSVLVIFDVFSREVFNQGIPWAQKSAVYLMIWGGFIGAIMVSNSATHLRPEVADKLWARFKNGPELFVRVQNFFMFVFAVIFFYVSIQYVKESFEFGDKSVVLNVPLWMLQLIIPYTFLSMSLRNIYFFMNPKKQIELKKEYA